MDVSVWIFICVNMSVCVYIFMVLEMYVRGSGMNECKCVYVDVCYVCVWRCVEVCVSVCICMLCVGVYVCVFEYEYIQICE